MKVFLNNLLNFTLSSQEQTAYDNLLNFFMSTPVEEVSIAEEKIMVYPNPVGSELIVDWPGPGDQRYFIIDAGGRIVKSGVLNSFRNIISVNDMDGGVYFLKMGKGAVKFVKR